MNASAGTSLTASGVTTPVMNTCQYNCTGGYTGANCDILPFVATGGTITYNGGYIIHTFTSNGTFQITSGSKNIEVLVVAG